MKSPVVKRSIVVAGRETSVSLEDGFWNELKKIAGKRRMTLSDLVAAIFSEATQKSVIGPSAFRARLPLQAAANARWYKSTRKFWPQ